MAAYVAAGFGAWLLFLVAVLAVCRNGAKRNAAQYRAWRQHLIALGDDPRAVAIEHLDRAKEAIDQMPEEP